MIIIILRVSVNNLIVVSQGLITLLAFMLTLHDLNKLSMQIEKNPDYLNEVSQNNTNLTNFTYVVKNYQDLISSCGINNATTLKVSYIILYFPVFFLFNFS
jgi:hypothetical protein